MWKRNRYKIKYDYSYSENKILKVNKEHDDIEADERISDSDRTIIQMKQKIWKILESCLTFLVM